jgi:uncharacterized RDD family membrane protein YckC
MTGAATPEYAGPVSRTLAYGFDTVLVAVTFTGGVVVTGLIASVVGARAHALVVAAGAAYLLVLPILFAFYCTVFWALAGRTPGMALLGVRVVATRGGRPSWLSALVRAVVLAYFPLGAVWALVDRRHQAVHDKLARTTVVRVLSALPPERVAGVPAAPDPDGQQRPLSMTPSIPRG